MTDIPDYDEQDIKEGLAFLTSDKDRVTMEVTKRLMPYLQYLPKEFAQKEIDDLTQLIMKETDTMYLAYLDRYAIETSPKYVMLTIDYLLHNAKQEIERFVEDSKKGNTTVNTNATKPCRRREQR